MTFEQGRRTDAGVIVAVVAVVLGACGPHRSAQPSPPAVPIGVGQSFHPSPLSAAARDGIAIGRLRCARLLAARFGVHVEVFADRRAVIVPAGIGIAPPQRRAGAYVSGGRCSYPARTVEPTGVIEVRSGRSLTLRDLFAIWGQPLSRRRVAAFSATPGSQVRAFVDGRPWRRDPGAIPLRRHAEVVLEIGGLVPPHSAYRFAPGL
ncbi:MAG TPA: hypothetical protein VHE14_04130 [Solirubrobacteraceae bacterium]|nr:hypothetical protein [Solirubrobacteraceae bacterium]